MNKPGEPYAVPHYEWHVQCELCSARRVLVPLGVAYTPEGAEGFAREFCRTNLANGWTRVAEMWRCPNHGESNDLCLCETGPEAGAQGSS